MRWGLIAANMGKAKAGLGGGGGRVNMEIIRALPDSYQKNIDLNRLGSIRAKLAIIAESKRVTEWAAYRQLDGVLNTIPVPPAPGPYVRAIYVHTSLWRRIGRSRWRPGLLRRWVMRQQMKHADGCIILTNSNWVRDDFISHGLPARTVYPPCDTTPLGDILPPEERSKNIISVGRLVKIKRHDWAASVADNLGVPCHIYGSGVPPDGGYGRKSHLYANVDWRRIEAASRRSKVIFSGCHVEDFGIAVVEGMVRGAIPVVPDLYGFRETVPFAELRYKPDDIISAVSRTHRAISGDFDHLAPDLMAHASQYTTERFRDTLRKHLGDI